MFLKMRLRILEHFHKQLIINLVARNKMFRFVPRRSTYHRAHV